LKDLNVETMGISVDPLRPTGSVDVQLGADGQPEFVIQRDVAWDHLVEDERLRQLMGEADAVCFGSLGQRSIQSRDSIRNLVQATRGETLRIFDVNLRQDFYSTDLIHESLELANVLKISDNELPVVATMLSLQGSVQDQIESLVVRYGLRMVAFTRGAEGSLLCDGVNTHEHSGAPTDVKDTIGAGDSFTAAVTLGMLSGWSLKMISDAANEVASHVCSCVGAIPPMPERVRQLFLVQARGNHSPDVGALSGNMITDANTGLKLQRGLSNA
jgi:fructokinase